MKKEKNSLKLIEKKENEILLKYSLNFKIL